MKRPSRNVRCGLVIAALVCAFVAVTDLALRPLHARGIGQGWMSHANSLSTLLSMPGLLLVVLPGLRQGHHTSAGVWLVMQALNFGVYTLAVALALRTWDAIAHRMGARRKTDARATDVPRVSRRRFITGGAGAVAGGALVAYPMSIATRRFEITRRTFAVRDLPPALHGLRIVQVTDIHHGPWIPLSHVRHIVATANALDPDLVLLTGDYVHLSPAYIPPAIDALSHLRAKIGVLGVLGNHDWWEDGPLTQRELARVGIPLIDNARRFVTPDRRLVEDASEGLCIAGVGDLYTDAQRYDDAFAGVPDRMPRLLLSHNPDVAEDPLLGSHRVDLMLSGHTHGGQVYLPGFGTPIVPSRFGQKYASGLVQGPTCPVFVCRGLGHTVLPLRVGVPPEMAVLELERARSRYQVELLTSDAGDQ